jgi:hypothetical protein
LEDSIINNYSFSTRPAETVIDQLFAFSALQEQLNVFPSKLLLRLGFKPALDSIEVRVGAAPHPVLSLRFIFCIVGHRSHRIWLGLDEESNFSVE